MLLPRSAGGRTLARMDPAVDDFPGEDPAVVLDVKYNYDDGKVVISTTPTKATSSPTSGKAQLDVSDPTPVKTPQPPRAVDPPLETISTPRKSDARGCGAAAGGGFLGTTAS